MKNTNAINSSESKKAKAKRLIAQISETGEMLDMYEFVENKYWRQLGLNSLQKCIDKYEVPSYDTFRRNYNAAAYQKKYLPGTEVGVIKESALRVICKKEHSAKIKLAVAQKILKAGQELNNITKNDIEAFIKGSKIVLGSKQKNKASEFAQLLVTDECFNQIEDYIEQNKMGPKKRNVFYKQIGLKVWSELKS